MLRLIVWGILVLLAVLPSAGIGALLMKRAGRSVTRDTLVPFMRSPPQMYFLIPLNFAMFGLNIWAMFRYLP